MKQIYIYETDYSRKLVKRVGGRDYTLFKKIGETIYDVDERIKSQFIGIPHDPDEKLYDLLYVTEATTNSGDPFSDKYVHGYLKHKGYYNIPDSEWFSIDIGELIDIIQEIKNNQIIYTNAIGWDILSLLDSSEPLTTIDISARLKKPKKYIQCAIQKLWRNHLVYRCKGYDNQSQKMRYYYTTQENATYKEIPLYSHMSERSNKFLYELNMSFEEIIDIIKDQTINEGTRNFSEVTGYSFSATEKFLADFRKEAEFMKLITYDTKTGYRNTARIIRKVAEG